MSKLEKVFDTPNKKAFIGFLTAGDPDADSTVKFILEMEKAGADLIEIGLGCLRNGLGQAGGSPAGRKVSHKHHQNLSFPVLQALGVL